MESTATKQDESSKAPVTQTESKPKGLSPFGYASVLAIGAYLGIIFAKSEVARWQRVHDMFLFREAHMYVIIGIGVAVATVAMFLI